MIGKGLKDIIKPKIVDVSVPYITFDGIHTTGIIQVNDRISNQTKKVFETLERLGFRIHKIEPANGRSDKELIDNNITTGFNLRLAISPNGPKRISKHGWGLAVDINPQVNPAEPDCGMTFCSSVWGILEDSHIKEIKNLGFDWGGEIFKGFWDSHHFEVPFINEELKVNEGFGL